MLGKSRKVLVNKDERQNMSTLRINSDARKDGELTKTTSNSLINRSETRFKSKANFSKYCYMSTCTRIGMHCFHKKSGDTGLSPTQVFLYFPRV